MARYKDPVVAEVKKIRHKISKRLAEAHRKGRLYQELRAIDRHADQVMAEVCGAGRHKKSV
jgi:hypothetical protein